MIGVKSDHISEMEKGKRPIGKEMAKHLCTYGVKYFLGYAGDIGGQKETFL
jgi:hypothetical protein